MTGRLIDCKVCGQRKENVGFGLCINCYRQTSDYKKRHSENQKKYYEKNKQYYFDYTKKWLKVDSNWKKMLEWKRKYSKNLVSHTDSTGVYEECLICRRIGQVKVHYKTNNKTGHSTNFNVVFQHYPQHIGRFETCCLSKEQQKKYIKYLNEVKEYVNK